MGVITCTDKKITYERRNEITVVEPYGRDCLRVRFTKNGKVSDEKWTLLDPDSQDECVIESDGQIATMTNGHISVKVDVGNPWFGGYVTFFKDGKQILKNRFEGDYDMRAVHTGGDNYRIKMIFDANSGEHFYGLGQERENIFDRKGSTSDLCHYNTKSSFPVVYSSLGYGFFWNNPAPGRVETTRNHTMWVADSAYQADFLIYTGDTPAEVLNKYCHLTGFAPKFPEWAAGFWQSKLRYECQEEVLEAAHEYKRRGIPISAIVIDFFHWTEQGDWKFDPEYWPDPAGLCKELLDMGIQPVVSVWPTVNSKSENFQYMSDKNYLVRTETGLFNTFDFCGNNTFMDATNPDAAKFVWSKIKKNYVDLGFKNFWLDEAEPETHPQTYSNFKFFVGNGAQTAMLYPYYYSKMFYEGLKEAGEEDIILLTRAGYPGSQKFGALLWSGDIESTFENLTASVKTGLSMSMSGIPWWNSDIGGFFGGHIETDYFKELIVRWMQFGLFCPVMRIHGDRAHGPNYVERHPGVHCPSGDSNEIWCFGDENYPILKRLIEIREKMRPYIMKYMDIASKEGKPVMRPMFFDYYDDEICYELEDQYMFGEDILFAPITEQGVTKRKVYLPEGEWTDINTGNTLTGKRWIEAEAPIDTFLAYVRAGADIISAFEK